LARFDWPGNVRQLRNVARRLAVTTHADPDATPASAIEPLLNAVMPHHMPTPVVPTRDAPTPAKAPPAVRTPPIREGFSPTGRWRPVLRKGSEISEAELLAALRARQWDLKPTAQDLGISRSVLYQLIEKCPLIRIAAQLEPAEIERALAQHGGDLIAAAAELEVSVQGLKLRMRSLGLH
ncbi:MAG: sigma-54-dependent Fis family transcriptional regulator, partial [Thermoanaerobaculia bacterium]|nr:sigma-54-dependent Fis family transcriptional regulator [Thermoanaerobaculia bacterium]